MLLVLYIGSTAFVWISTIKYMHDNKKRLKDEGYKFTSRNHFGIGDIFIFGIVAILMSIPVANLIIPLSSHDKERSYDEYKNYLLDAGAIEEKDEEIKIDNIKQIKEVKVINKNNNKEIYIPLYRDDNEIEKGGYTYKKELFKK